MTAARQTIFLLLLLLITPLTGAVDLVVNKAVPHDTLSRSTVRSIFSMRTTSWPDGIPIHVFVLGDKSELHAQFSKKILGVFPHQLRRAWNRQIFTGTGQAPTKVDTEQEMIDQIGSTPGAIGYISEGNINERIRKIAVE
jgi:ABC-type phosphate transport system substrate-binding protein